MTQKTNPIQKYIYVVQADYTDPLSEADWNEWYSEVHIPDLLSVPGWLSSQRYRAISGVPKYLTVHEIESPRIFGSPAHQKVAGWGQWEDRIANFSRGIFTLVSKHTR
jgi:hypothetical protein